MIIKSDAEFDRSFDLLRDLLGEIEAAEPSPELVGKIQRAAEINQALESWISDNVRDSISVLIGLMPFCSNEENQVKLDTLRRSFPEYESFIIAECKSNNIYGFKE